MNSDLPSSTNYQDGLPTPQRYWAAAGLLLVIMIGVIDTSITNIALPTIAKDLDISPAAVIWIVNAYMITIISTLLPFSALAERLGFRRMFRIGVGIFMLGAIGSMLADSLLSLAISRTIQGLGCSCFMSLFGGLVRNIYPRSKLAFGISLNAMIVGGAALVSPSLGAFIISIASWHWIYGFTIPLCFIALYFSLFLPRIERVQSRFDYLSAILNAITLGGFICALDLLFTSPITSAILFVVITISGYFLYQRARQQEAPLVPLDLFRITVFRDAIIISSLCFTAATMVMVSAPFYFQNTLQMPTHIVGLLFSSWPIAGLFTTPLAARLSNRYPSSLLAGIGNVILCIGIIILLTWPTGTHPFFYGLSLFICGLGFGFFQTPNNKAMLLSTPNNRSSATGGMQSTARLFGQSTGAALVAVCFVLDPQHGHFYAMATGAVVVMIAASINLIRYINKSDISVI